MDILFEFLFELIFEGLMEASQNTKVPSIIRIPLLIVILAFFALIIGGIFIIGICSLKESLPLSILLIIVSCILLIGCIIKFYKIYKEKTHEKR